MEEDVAVGREWFFLKREGGIEVKDFLLPMLLH